jgi:hypothetical protein
VSESQAPADKRKHRRTGNRPGSPPGTGGQPAGVSGNLLGPPKGYVQLRTALSDLVTPEQRKKIVGNFVKEAMDGKQWAVSIWMTRCEPQPQGRFVEFEVPEITAMIDVPLAIGAVVRAVAEGKLTIAEGDQFASLLSKLTTAVETVEIHERLLRLEEHLP